MAYDLLGPGSYQHHVPDSPRQVGTPGWSRAPVPSWGQNPETIGPPMLGALARRRATVFGAADESELIELDETPSGIMQNPFFTNLPTDEELTEMQAAADAQAAATAAPIVTTPTMTAPVAAPSSRRGLLLLGAVAGVAALAVVGYLVMRPRLSPNSEGTRPRRSRSLKDTFSRMEAEEQEVERPRRRKGKRRKARRGRKHGK